MYKTKGMLIGAAAALALAGTASSALAAICGDSDNSGQVAINDVSLHLRVISGIDPAAGLCGGAGYANCGNLNGNGAGPTDISDTDLLLQRVSGVNPCPSDRCLAEVIHPGGNLPSTITGNYRVSADATFANLTFVESGAVLTIDPGVTLRGTAGLNPPSTLIVKPGGRINAVGNAAQPITVTSSLTPGGAAKEDIGGIAILGRAPVNEANITLEGLNPTPDVIFGGTDVNDFSGCVSYFRSQFSGRDLTPDNELNLFVMAGVGRTTRIDHVHAHLGADDCIEWFGGTVNTKFMIGSACGDDGLDSQLGYRGGTQFALVAQRLADVETGGSNGFEMDNSEFGFDNEPRSNPKFCNVTAIGIKGQAGIPPATNQVGVFSRRGNAFTVANSIVKDFGDGSSGGGYQMRDAATAARACVNSSTLNTAAPFGVIQNSLFNNNGAGGAGHAINHSSCDTPGECTCTTTEHFALLQAQRNVTTTADAGVAAIGGSTFPPTALVPPGGSLPDTAPAANCTTIDSSFVNAPYIGAFEPGGTDWTAGWAAYPLN